MLHNGARRLFARSDGKEHDARHRARRLDVECAPEVRAVKRHAIDGTQRVAAHVGVVAQNRALRRRDVRVARARVYRDAAAQRTKGPATRHGGLAAPRNRRQHANAPLDMRRDAGLHLAVPASMRREVDDDEVAHRPCDPEADAALGVDREREETFGAEGRQRRTCSSSKMLGERVKL